MEGMGKKQQLVETKRYLSQVNRLNKQIENKLEERAQLRTMATNIAARIEKDKVQTSKEPDRMGEAVVKIVDLEREIDELVDKFIDKRALIVAQIDGLENLTYYNILSRKYIIGKTFEQIAVDLNHDMRYVFRLHNKAIKAFEDRYGETYLKKD